MRRFSAKGRAPLGALLSAASCAFAVSALAQTPDVSGCIVPRDQIIADVPVDGIPPLDLGRGANFISPEESPNTLPDQEFVLGVSMNGEIKAYPLRVMFWHEIVNDAFGGEPVVVTYCPLTVTGIVFKGRLGDDPLTFGNTGALWENNLVMYDRQTQSVWSQMRLQALCGSHMGRLGEILPVVETTWRRWKELHPGTLLLDERQTGFTRPYQSTPFIERSYEEDPILGFPSSFNDRRLPLKARVLGFVDLPFLLPDVEPSTQPDDHEAVAYPFDIFEDQDVVNDAFMGEPLVIVFDRDERMAIPYSRSLDGRVLTFRLLDEGSPFNLIDRETGTHWNVLGHAIEGPLTGEKLRQIPAYNAFWFGWAVSWPATEIATRPDEPTAVEGTGDDSGATPVQIQLHQNAPNPFNQATEIRFTLFEPSDISLAVFDTTGALVRTLAVGRFPAGLHALVWDGTDEGGRDVASGVYVYRLKVGGVTQDRQMTLIR